MSTKSGNAGCGKVIGYVLLIGVGLVLVRSVYYGLCYVGLNTLLALDQSAYVHLAHSHWLGYALLGFELGAAGGAIAAQRRYGLNQGIAIGGWVLLLGLLATVYASAAEAGPGETETVTEAAKAPETPEPDYTTTTAEPVAPPAPLPQAAPATLLLAYDYLKAHGQQVPANYDDFVAGMQQPGQLHRLYSYLQGQNLVMPASYEDFVTSMAVPEPTPTEPATTEAEPATDDPEADEAPTTPQPDDEATEPRATVETAQPPVAVAPVSRPRLAGLVLPTKKKTPPAPPTEPTTSVAVAPAAPAHPTGHRQYTGRVAALQATYSLDWQPNGELSGSYFYNQQPAIIYRLSGAIGPGGELHLAEFTRGRQTARCVLQPQGAGFAGTMLNTDGRQFSMSLE